MLPIWVLMYLGPATVSAPTAAFRTLAQCEHARHAQQPATFVYVRKGEKDTVTVTITPRNSACQGVTLEGRVR